MQRFFHLSAVLSEPYVHQIKVDEIHSSYVPKRQIYYMMTAAILWHYVHMVFLLNEEKVLHKERLLNQIILQKYYL